MNYSRNMKKASIGKRIIISWLLVAIAASLMGFAIGLIITRHTKAKAVERTEIRIYGQAEGIVSKTEMPVEWVHGNLKFTPLNVPADEELQKFIFYLSSCYDIDYAFVMALIAQESNFQADCVSDCADYGLMQINAINHEYIQEQLGITDFLNPQQNVKAGIFILRKLFDKYETPEKVLMVYNMGESGASQLWAEGVFESKYSKSVLEIQAKFNAELERKVKNDQM